MALFTDYSPAMAPAMIAEAANAIGSKHRPSVPAPRAGRMIQLDALRGVAILLVLGHHPVIQPQDAGSFRMIAVAWHRFGWTGVTLFFVLSGFLIGGLIFNEIKRTGGFSAARFLVRRTLKIWPSYYVYLVTIISFEGLIGHFRRGHSWGGILGPFIPSLMNIQNYYYWRLPKAHTWSLGVEEQFYVALPLLVVYLGRSRCDTFRNNLVGFPAVALALASLCLVSRAIGSLALDAHRFAAILPQTQFQIDGLLVGVVLSYFNVFHEGFGVAAGRFCGAIFSIGVLLVSPMLWLTAPKPVIALGFPLLVFGYSCILISLIHCDVGRGLVGRLVGCRATRLLSSAGFYSYGIYLWHMDAAHKPLIFLLRATQGIGLPDSLRWLIATSAFIATSCLAGSILSNLIEKPFLSIRDRFYPSRASALP